MAIETYLHMNTLYIHILWVAIFSNYHGSYVPALAIKNQHSLFETGSKNMLLKNVGMYIVLTWNM